MRNWLVIVGVLLGSGPAGAAPDLTYRGFGTLGVVHNFSDGAGIVRDIGQADAPRGETRFDLDSRMGVQIRAEFSPGFSAVVQAVSFYNEEANFNPEVSWAYLKYEPSPHHLIRLGRVGWDIYPNADSRHVGYSFTWTRPPVDYFGWLQMDWLDGGDYQFTTRLPLGVLNAKLYAGITSDRAAIDRESHVDLDGTAMYGGHVEYSLNNWQLRAGYSRLDLDAEVKGEQRHLLDSILEDGPPEMQALIRGLDLIHPSTEGDLYSSSVIYDRGPLNVQLLLSLDKYSGSEMVDETRRGMFSLQYRVGKTTPYFTWSRALTTAQDSPIDDSLNTWLEDQYSLSVGFRFDIGSHVALKVQADHFEFDKTGRHAVLLREVQPGWNGKINLMSATLDFVF